MPCIVVQGLNEIMNGKVANLVPATWETHSEVLVPLLLSVGTVESKEK